MTAIPLQRDDVYYPESDGQPMAETDIHRDLMVELMQALRRRYRRDPDVYVTGNLFFYFVKGDPRAVLAPDLFLVKGVPKGKRRTYKLWEEGRVPSLVVELTSDSTRREDLSKKDIYRRLGVEECFLFDPCQDYLKPSLQGYRLRDGQYRAIEPEADGALLSLATGLLLRREGEMLRLVDVATGEPLPWSEELEEELERLRRDSRSSE